MEQKTIVFVIWLNKELPLFESIVYFNELIKKELDKSFKKIKLSILNNTKFYLKSFGNNPKGMNKMKFFFEENKTNDFKVGFALELLLKNCNYKAVDIDMHINYSISDKRTISFMFNEMENQQIDIERIISKTCNYLHINGVAVKYGFGFVMDNNKIPGFFCNGIHTENLTETEKEIVTLISNRDIDALIEKPFYIQIINKKFVSYEIINTIIIENKFKDILCNDTVLIVNKNNYEI